MKNLNKKYLVLLASVALLLTFSVGSTVAFLVDKADEVVNTFTPTHLKTDVEEKFAVDETTDALTKSSIKIRNDGSIDAYVRVFVTGNWVNDNNEVVAPWTGTLSVNSADWVAKTENGLTYYYYTKRLLPEDNTATEDVVEDMTSNLLAGAIVQSGGPEGAHLVINVIHQSIQADGVNANNVPVVTAVWGATVDENGNISK